MTKKRTGQKIFAIVIFLVLVSGAGYYLYYQSVKQAKAPAASEEVRSQAQNPARTGTTALPQTAGASPTSTPATQLDLGNKKVQGTFSGGEGDAAGPDIVVMEVDFDGSQFSPTPVNIKVNDWVFFKNKSTVDLWVASNPHPAHTDYPGFDSKQNIPPGGEYKFQFTKAGNWEYHDHLNPAILGVVNVAE